MLLLVAGAPPVTPPELMRRLTATISAGMVNFNVLIYHYIYHSLSFIGIAK